MIDRVLNRLFKREEINGHDRCPPYMIRWTLFQPRRPKAFWRGFGVYVHKFVGDDWTRDLHDHPKRFISIGLVGSYRETYLVNLQPPDVDAPPLMAERKRDYVAPWVRTFPADHTHRLELIGGKPCWTLVIVLRSVRAWGFWTRLRGGWKWTGWREYVAPGNEDAARGKVCD